MPGVRGFPQGSVIFDSFIPWLDTYTVVVGDNMGMRRDSNESSGPLGWQPLGASGVLLLSIAFLTLGAPVRSQEPPPPAQSIADVSRNVRAHKSNSTKPSKVVTNDELSGQYSVAGASASPLQSPTTNEAEAPKPSTAGCDNPAAEALKTDLQLAQEEQDLIRRELSNHSSVISNGDVDLKNFKPGSSGLNVGAPPLLETQSPIPARVTEVNLEEKIASLKRALTIACASPEDAGTQAKLNHAEQELSFLQRQLALDQSTYYSKPNYAEDTAGKARLDAELQQKQDLQAEIERLKSELAASKAN